jgi:hypothetical protein
MPFIFLPFIFIESCLSLLAGGKPFARQGRVPVAASCFETSREFGTGMNKRKENRSTAAQRCPFQTNGSCSDCTSDEFHDDRFITVHHFLSVVDNADLTVGTFTTVL